MVRIPDVSDIESVSAQAMRAPNVRATAEDFGAGTGEAMTGMVKAGLKLIQKKIKENQPIEDDAFITAGMAEGRRHLGQVIDDNKADGGEADPETLEKILTGEIHPLVERLRFEGRYNASPEAVGELKNRLSALKGVFLVRAATSGYRAQQDRYAADLESSMGTFAEIVSGTPDNLDDVLADTRDAMDRAGRHLPAGQSARLRGLYEPAITEAAVRGHIARDPSMAADLLKAKTFDYELPAERKAALLTEAETARDQGRLVTRAGIMQSIEDHLKDLASGGAGVSNLGAQAAEVLDEKDFTGFQAQEQIARDVHDAFMGLRFAPADKVMAGLERHRPTQGAKSPITSRKFRALQSEADRILEERRKDGAAYAMGMPAVKAVFEIDDPGAYERALSVRLDVQGIFGLSDNERRVLTGDEASETAGQLQAMEPVRLAAEVTELRNRFGKHLPRALDEMAAAGLDPRTSVVAATAGKPALADRLARVIATGNAELRKGLPDADTDAVTQGIRDALNGIDLATGKGGDGYLGHPDGIPPMAEGLALTYYRQTGTVNSSVTRAIKEIIPRTG